METCSFWSDSRATVDVAMTVALDAMAICRLKIETPPCPGQHEHGISALERFGAEGGVVFRNHSEGE